MVVVLTVAVPTAGATPALTCTGSNPGANGVLDVAVSSAADTDSLTVAESGGDYSLSVTSGGSTTAVCTGTTYPDSGNSGFPTVEVTGSALIATDFEAGGDSGLTFEGQAGAANMLDLSDVPSSQSTPLGVNVSGAPVNSLPNDEAVAGTTTFAFQNITTFAGASTGWTTFFAGSSGGFTFDAAAATAGNVLDLGAANAGLDVQVADGMVSQLTSGTDSFSNIQTFNGPAGGDSVFGAGAPDGETFNVPGNGNTLYGSSGSASFIASGNGNDFVTGTGDETFSDSGTGNTLDFYEAAASQAAPLIVNLSGTTVAGVANDTAANGSATYSFGGIQTFKGSSSGSTRFVASGTNGGYTFDSNGGDDTLDLSFWPESVSGTVVDVPDGVALQGGLSLEDYFVGITTFDSPTSGLTTFSANSTPGYTFNGTGPDNVLDLSDAGSGVTASVPDGTATLGASGLDRFSGISAYEGSSSGGTTLVAGSGSLEFDGQGSGNALDLSHVPASGSTPLDVNVSGAPVDSLADDSAAAGGTTFTFSDVSDFTGSSSGHTTFFAGSVGGFGFDGGGGVGNSLDLSAANSGLLVAATTGKVSGLTSGTDGFSGVQEINGSAGGDDLFAGGATDGLTFDAHGNGNSFVPGTGSATFDGGSGSGNELDMSNVSTLSSTMRVNLTGSTVDNTPSDTVTVATNTTYAFSGIAIFDGPSSGNTIFYADGTGGYTFTGAGSDNLLDLAAAGPNMTVSPQDGTVTLASGSDDISGIQTFVGSSSGSTDFIASGTIGGESFNAGAGSGDTLDLSAMPYDGFQTLVGVGVSRGIISWAEKSDSFSSGITNLIGSGSGHTTFATGTGGFTFTGGGTSGNEIELGAVTGDTSISVPQGNVTGLAGGDDDFSDIQKFDGSPVGKTTFVGGSEDGDTFVAEGAGSILIAGSGSATFNCGGEPCTLDFSNVATTQASPLTVNLSGEPVGGTANDTATVGSTTYSFFSTTSFTGPQSGNTTFLAGSTGGLAFNAQGSDNVVDLSAAPNATVTVNGDSLADPGVVSGLFNFDDSFSDIQSFPGAAAVLYRLSVARLGGGAGSVTSSPSGIDCGSTCSHNFASGTDVSLTATPADGSRFAGWSGACSGTGSCSVPMSSTTSVSATFEQLPSYALSVTKSGSGSGTVTSSPSGIDCGSDCSENFTNGTSVTLTAAAAAGSTFAGWSGACSGTADCTVAMTAARSVTATFAAVPPSHTLSVAKSGNGAGTVTSSPSAIDCGSTCSHGFASGAKVILTAVAGAGSTFDGWSGACSGTGACAVTVSADTSVVANFTRAVPPAPTCVVPKVKGKTLKAAERAIKANHCEVGKISHSHSKTVKKGRVIAEKPGPGRRVAPGAKVRLVVSTGRRK